MIKLMISPLIWHLLWRQSVSKIGNTKDKAICTRDRNHQIAYRSYRTNNMNQIGVAQHSTSNGLHPLIYNKVIIKDVFLSFSPLNYFLKILILCDNIIGFGSNWAYFTLTWAKMSQNHGPSTVFTHKLFRFVFVKNQSL